MVQAVVTTMQPEAASAMKRDSNVIGIDIAKRVLHVIGMDTRGTIILRKHFY